MYNGQDFSSVRVT